MGKKINPTYQDFIIDGLDETWEAFKESGNVVEIEIHLVRNIGENRITGDIGKPFTDYVLIYEGLLEGNPISVIDINDIFFEDVDYRVIVKNEIIKVVQSEVTPSEPLDVTPDLENYIIDQRDFVYIPRHNQYYNITKDTKQIYIGDETYYFLLYLQGVGE